MSTSTLTTTSTSFPVNKKNDKMKELSVLGIVSFAAVVHSHLYWVYSIIYIAYHKITPNEETSPVMKWRSKQQFKQNDSLQNTLITAASKKKKKVHRHSRKKSLTNKPKSVIMPTIASPKVALVTSGTTVDALLSSAPKQHRVPLLHALRTFPSPSAKQSHPTFNIHQLIKSQRKMPKRSSSTGELNKDGCSLPALMEVETRNSEDSFSSGSGTDSSLTPASGGSSSKKSRAMGLLRSTFHRSLSTDTMMINRASSSYSSLSEDENVIAVVAAKKRKRDAILGLTRKFSGRRATASSNNSPILLSSETVVIESPGVDDIKKQQRMKLFRSLPSWKKEKHTATI